VSTKIGKFFQKSAHTTKISPSVLPALNENVTNTHKWKRAVEYYAR
jgi:hypothetical protein